MPEVLGVEEQRCPHCAAVIEPRARAPDAGTLLARGFRGLLSPAPWVVFLLPALAFDLATVGGVLLSPDFAGVATSCGGAPVRPTIALGVVSVAWLFVVLTAYFAGWAAFAARRAGVALERAWWANAVAGSAMLAGIFTLGLLLLVLPALFFFVWFLLSPVAIGLGARPLEALDRGRAVGRLRPPAFTLLVVLLFVFGQLLLLLAACVPTPAGSLAAQGLVWWLLAPVIPVLTTEAYLHLARAPRPTEDT